MSFFTKKLIFDEFNFIFTKISIDYNIFLKKSHES